MLCPRLLFDKSLVPAPCFVLDAPRLAANAAVLDTVQRRTGAKILLALKAFAAFAAFPLLSTALCGACARALLTKHVLDAKNSAEKFTPLQLPGQMKK